MKTKVTRLRGIITATAGAAVIAAGSLGVAAPVMAAPAANASYITQADAKNAALKHAGVNAGRITGYEIELDRERSGVYYDIEFTANGYEYDYKINAKNATVVKSEKKAVKSKTNKTKTTSTKTNVTYIGKNKAKTVALNHAKADAGKIKGLKIEFEKGKSTAYYEVEFTVNGYKYDYDINAVTGKVIKFEKKALKTTQIKPAAASVVSSKYIGEAKAKSVALNHAGIAASKAYAMKCKLDREKGVYIYEVEFKSGRYEYEYDINAVTGKIMKYDKEID